MSSAAIFCFCLLALASNAYGSSVLDYMEQIKHMKMAGPVANKFSFRNCGGPKDMANFTSLTVSPSPIKAPVDIQVSFAVDVFDTIDGNDVNLNVTVLIYAQGQWIKMPCVLEVGSCYYADACSYLSPIEECPKPFLANNIPCKCPFKPGKYNMPVSTFHVDSGFPAAVYSIKVDLRKGIKPVACAVAEIEFA